MKFQTAIIFKKVGAEDDPFICGVAHSASLVLKKQDIEILPPSKHKSANEHTLMVVIGGDGTMLTAAREAVLSGATLLGINTGHLGFLTEFSPNDIVETIENAVNGKIKIEERTMLQLNYRDEVFYALNDFIMSNVLSDNIVKYQLHIGETGASRDNAGKHHANSLIISTPTGSTAYSLNVGGSILAPNLDVMQIIPIAAMTMTSRPIVVSGNSSIQVHMKTTKPDSEISLKSDGQEILRLSEAESRFKVSTYKNKVRMIHHEQWNFYHTLTEKLQWNRELV